MRYHHPNDINREQFAKIRTLLESARKKTAPRTVELYEVLSAAHGRNSPLRKVLDKQVGVQITKCSQLHCFKVIPKCWAMKHSFAYWKRTGGCGKAANGNLIIAHNLFSTLGSST